jgi:hypothetical protein
MRYILGAILTAAFLAFLVWPAPAAPDRSTLNLKVTDEHIDFLVDRQLVGRYHFSPSGANTAKPFFWPLNGPGGVPITRAWPMEAAAPDGSTDHVHQKSAWFDHGDIIPEGISPKERSPGVVGIDFWSEAKGAGRIVGQIVAVDRPGARVLTRNEWRTADGRKILSEARTIHLYDFDGTRLFVFDIDLLASEMPLTFGDTKEGSMGIRINDAIRESKTVRVNGRQRTVAGAGKLENAEGKIGEKAIWGQPSGWCDYSGPIEGKVMGLAILDDPKNPYPACWHSRGYGLMAANPFGREKSGFPAMKDRTDLVRLAKGEHLKFRYGLLIHSGDARTGKVAEYFERFVKLRD